MNPLVIVTAICFIAAVMYADAASVPLGDPTSTEHGEEVFGTTSADDAPDTTTTLEASETTSMDGAFDTATTSVSDIQATLDTATTSVSDIQATLPVATPASPYQYSTPTPPTTTADLPHPINATHSTPLNVIVRLSLSLPMSLADFNASMQRAFKESMAAAAGVGLDGITLTVRDGSLSRRLLEPSIGVDVAIRVPDGQDAKLVATLLTAERINVELASVGLPAAIITSAAAVGTRAISQAADVASMSQITRAATSTPLFRYSAPNPSPFLTLGTSVATIPIVANDSTRHAVPTHIALLCSMIAVYIVL